MEHFRIWWQSIALSALLLIIFFLAVSAIHSAARPSEAIQGTAEEMWRPGTWTPVTVFTLTLTVATVGLLHYTKRLWQATVHSLAEAKKTGEAAIKASVVAADAATRSADAAVAALNRPWLVAQIAADNVKDFLAPRDFRITTKIVFENYGDAFAQVVGAWATIRVWRGWPIPREDYDREREYLIRHSEYLSGTVVSPGGRSVAIECDCNVDPGKQLRSLYYNKPENSIALIGQVFYLGPIGDKINETAFSFRLSFMGSGFIVDPDPTYRHRT